MSPCLSTAASQVCPAPRGLGLRGRRGVEPVTPGPFGGAGPTPDAEAPSASRSWEGGRCDSRAQKPRGVCQT